MAKSKAVHQCLFCQQTFDSAAAKDDHILEHFDQEKCTECKEDLIRIGGYLYTRHNEATCMKKTAIAEKSVESCTSTESIQTTPKSHTLTRNLRSNNKSSRALDAARTPQIKTEPKDFDESVSATSGNEMMSSVLVDGLSIQQRFPNVNLNPVVMLEDILTKKTDTTRPLELKRCKMENDLDLQNSVHFENQKYKCQSCSMTFKRKQYLREHMTIHTGVKPYMCKYAHCEERFRSRQQKYQHVLCKHSREKSSACAVDEREKTFSTEGSLEHRDNEHDTANTPTTNYSCYICSEVFNAKTNLVKHIEEKHETVESCNEEHQSIEPVEPQRDNLNGVELKNKEEELLIGLKQNKLRHEQIHTGERPFTCEIDGCKRAFADNRALKIHVEREHGISTLNYSCDICSEIFNTKFTLIKHIKEKHPTSKIRNTQAQHIEPTQQQDEQSVATNHQEEEYLNGANFEIKVEEELIIEPQANEPNSQQEISHELIGGDVTADNGDETLVSQNPAESHHMRPNTESGEIICGICKRKFTKWRNLQAHIARQHGPNSKIFKCGVCGLFCFYRRELQAHIESVHLNIRKHKCNACGKSFRWSQHLQEHMKIHTGIRSYKCSYEDCGKRFITNARKVQHERVHSGERPYICEINGCEISYTNNRSLSMHRRREHGISIVGYSCGTCRRVFKKNANLVKHIQLKHPSAIKTI